MYSYNIEYSCTKRKSTVFESAEPITRSEWSERLKSKHPDSNIRILSFNEIIIDQSKLSLDFFGKDLTEGLHAFKIRDENHPEWRYYAKARIKLFQSHEFNVVFVRVYEGVEEDDLTSSFDLSYVNPSSCLVHYSDQDSFYVDFLRDIVKDEGITKKQLKKLVEEMSD